MFGRKRKRKPTPVPAAQPAPTPMVIVTVKRDSSGVFIQSMGSQAVEIPAAHLQGLIALLANAACKLQERRTQNDVDRSQ